MPEYINQAIVNVNGNLYFLLKSEKTDLPNTEKYLLYAYNPETRITDTSKYKIYHVEKVRRRRYAPYAYNTMLLLSWAFASEQLSTKRSARINVTRLDKWFDLMYQEYSDGVIDISTVLAP